MKKVGEFKCYRENSKGQKVSLTYTYLDVPEIDGWVNAKEFMPANFDLCELKINGKKNRGGWAVGSKFDGLNIKPSDEVLYWKKQSEPK